MNPEKVLRLIVQGRKGIRFSDFIRLIEAFGFTLDRESGSHHIFKREGIEEMVNIQNYKGEAKPYQVRQFLEIVEKYGFSLEKRE
ncbi:MAG: type II toxin-antitoxin system HicA family toxin [Spirochaetia bacterium]|nr:type II toxin-antitoxin system HicA family toxin [Spirochaetia bacterium]